LVWLSLVSADGHAGVSGTLCQFGKYRRSETSGSHSREGNLLFPYLCSHRFRVSTSFAAAPSFPTSLTVPYYRALRASCTNARARLPVDLSTLSPLSPALLDNGFAAPPALFPQSYILLSLLRFTFESVYPRLINHRWPFDCPRLTSRLIRVVNLV